MLDSGSVMEIVQLIIGIIVVLSVKFLIIKTIYDRIRISNLTGDKLKFDNIRPIYKKLKRGKLPNSNRIEKYSYNLEKRTLVYDVLDKFDKKNLFPKELLTIEKSSESYLANWLNMCDDYDDFPNEIFYENRVDLKDGKTILIFKFKAYEPHILAEKGWLIGYVGYKSSKIELYKKPDILMSYFRNEVLNNSDLEKMMI
jgi:hypothetical protein